MSAGSVPSPSSPSAAADPARISARAHALSVAAARLDSDAVTLAVGVRAAAEHWTGPAAAAFGAYLVATDMSRQAATAALRTAAARLEAHAEAVAAGAGP